MTYARRIIGTDMEAVVAMAAAFHAESPVHSPYPFNADKVRALVTSAIANPDWLALAAFDDDGLVGVALVYALPMFFSDALQGGDLAFYVQPGRRGTRAAIELLEEIEKWRSAKGVAVMEMGINTGINHDRALSFFMKCGFRPAGLIIRK